MFHCFMKAFLSWTILFVVCKFGSKIIFKRGSETAEYPLMKMAPNDEENKDDSEDEDKKDDVVDAEFEEK